MLTPLSKKEPPFLMKKEQFDLELLISDQTIQQKIREIALQLEEDYKGEALIIVMVMKGAICLVADLIRNLSFPFELEYIHAGSYSLRGMTPGEVKLQEVKNLDLKGKHVLIVDDILDTGNTLATVVKVLHSKSPATLKTLVLLEKKIERTTKIRAEYIIFKIENHFVVGYGLDFKEYFRGLPGIYILKQ